MENLKSYFSPHSKCEEDSGENVEKKKKKRKRKEEKEEAETPKKKKEVKKSLSDSSKENLEDDFEEEKPKNNLLNYFNKVEKDEAKVNNKVVVKALVHHPPTNGEERPSLITRLRVRRRTGKEPEYDIIVPLDDNETNHKNKNDKPKIDVHPIFKNHRPMRETNEIRSAAVQSFLHSGPSITVKKPKEIVEGVEAPFPKISHVFQKDAMNLIWSLPLVKMQLKDVINSVKVPPWSSITDRKVTHRMEPEVKTMNQKKALKSLKNEQKDLPISGWHREIMRQKKLKDGEMWTEKYKLENLDQTLWNKNEMNKLKVWLQSFKEKKVIEIKDDSEDEFIDDDEISSKVIKNIAVINGPVGCGKTASVYALAKEIGYEVLELNASCNRTGKKIHKDFSEALQSHNANVMSFTPNKKKKVENEKKRTLILIEDADLLFANFDDGYSQTIINLALSTKRPIIFISEEKEMKNLSKLRPHFEMVLDFKRVDVRVLSSWLKVVAIAENLNVDGENLMKLTSETADVRKCLLQLQLFRESLHLAEFGNKLDDSWNVIGLCNLSCKNMIKETAKLTNLICRNDHNIKEPFIASFGHEKLKNSTSLLQNFESESILGQEIADYSVELLHRITGAEEPFRHHKNNVVDSMAKSADDLLPLSVHLSRRSICADYMPSLRQVARSEKIRLATQSKRTNRFNHYLMFLGLETNEDVILDTFCSSFNQ